MSTPQPNVFVSLEGYKGYAFSVFSSADTKRYFVARSVEPYFLFEGLTADEVREKAKRALTLHSEMLELIVKPKFSERQDYW
jgi:predicted RNase H-like HicB family nuclease